MIQPAPRQPYAQTPPGATGEPLAGGNSSPGMVAKIKEHVPLTIAVVCFLFVIFYAFIMRAFDIDDRDIRRFLGTAGICSAASGFLALLVAAFSRAIDREDAPTTFGPALLTVALLIMLAGSTGIMLVR